MKYGYILRHNAACAIQKTNRQQIRGECSGMAGTSQARKIKTGKGPG
jgi:hypothetical protein